MRIHLTGIKGVGMTGLAQILQSQNHNLTGSDVAEDFVTKKTLEKLNLPIFEFDQTNITPDIDLLIHSAAFDQNNPEIKKAKSLNIKTQKYSQALADLFNKSQGLAVTGTHGKTTTSALLAHTLVTSGADPTAVIGAPVIDFDRMNARSGQGKFFVIEACEFQNSFHNYFPLASIITNIDHDHLDFFPKQADYDQAFHTFATQVKEVIVIRESDSDKITHSHKITFALDSDTADFTAGPLQIQSQQITFPVFKNQAPFDTFTIHIPGQHNVENALGVIALCDWLGMSKTNIHEGLSTFHGTARRQEIRGEQYGITVIDDYGHHPDEIQATIQAIKQWFPDQRLTVAFQSHTHTRTRALLQDFAKSFQAADLLFLADVFPSAREQDFDAKVQISELQTAIQKQSPNLKIIPIGPTLSHSEIAKAAQLIHPHLKKDDILLTIGAGETDKLASAFLGQDF